MKNIVKLFVIKSSLGGWIGLSLLIPVLWIGCKEEGRLDHIDQSAPAPKLVTVTKVRDIHGGVAIRYKVPNDKNLAGVVAVFERAGEICEVKASVYVDSVVIEGFGDMNTRTVKLHSIGWNGKRSDAVNVEAHPLLPPVLAAVKKLNAAFGGVGIAFSNHAEANLSIVLMCDTLGNNLWEPLQIFYTKADTGVFYKRGLLSKEQKFAVFVRDRWGNKSDTLISYITPVEEFLLPKDTYKNVPLPSDTWIRVEADKYNIETLWDNVWGSAARASNSFTTPHDSPMPQHFTINFGYRASISRYKVYQRYNQEYSGSCVRTWELYGWQHKEPPTKDDDSFDRWTFLGTWEAFKPSGYAADGSVGTITAEDRTYAMNDGIDVEMQVTESVPDPFVSVTHIRFRSMSTFETHGTDSPQGQIFISELTFWGVQKDE